MVTTAGTGNGKPEVWKKMISVEEFSFSKLSTASQGDVVTQITFYDLKLKDPIVVFKDSKLCLSANQYYQEVNFWSLDDLVETLKLPLNDFYGNPGCMYILLSPESIKKLVEFTKDPKVNIHLN